MNNSSTKNNLRKHNLAPHKRFGQNFLVNQHVAQSIVDCGNIADIDSVIEVGVGLGALTVPLAKRAKRVIGVEIDSGLIRYHEEEKILPSNVTLIHNDILKTDFTRLTDETGAKLKIIANLPYSISNPFIFKLIEHTKLCDWAVVMLQKEVAERLVASPSTKNYGIPSVLLQSCARITQQLTVKPHEFHPQPKVDSVVIKIDFNCIPEEMQKIETSDRKIFTQLVRSSFAKRRKTLLNNLSSAPFFSDKDSSKTKVPKTEIVTIIENAGIAPTVRAENLRIKDFVDLTLSVKNAL